MQIHHRCLEGGHAIGGVDRRCRRVDRGEWQRVAGEREMACLCCTCMLWTCGGVGRGQSGKGENQAQGEGEEGDLGVKMHRRWLIWCLIWVFDLVSDLVFDSGSDLGSDLGSNF